MPAEPHPEPPASVRAALELCWLTGRRLSRARRRLLGVLPTSPERLAGLGIEGEERVDAFLFCLGAAATVVTQEVLEPVPLAERSLIPVPGVSASLRALEATGAIPSADQVLEMRERVRRHYGIPTLPSAARGGAERRLGRRAGHGRFPARARRADPARGVRAGAPAAQGGTAMTGPGPDAHPLAPWLTLARLDEALGMAVRRNSDREDWVELLMDRLPRDWRMPLMAEVARAEPLRPDGRAFLPHARWERERAVLLEEAQVTLAYRDALLWAEAGPTEDALAKAPHLEPWRVLDLGRPEPHLEGRLTSASPEGPGEIGPTPLLALGPGHAWARLRHGWVRLGRWEKASEAAGARGLGLEASPRILDQPEIGTALEALRRRVEHRVAGLLMPGAQGGPWA